MANNRKIQGEIDRLLKKITEGMEVYEDIYEKFSTAPNQTLKERFEGDLKKEIKKLQRLREQIKALLTGGEVKDKKSLETARRNIELKMEAFKVCERETKTKAFSKEGLASDAKANPQDAAKAASAQWIRDAIQELREQIDAIEYEIECDGGKKKKGVDPREDRIGRAKYHIIKLEQLLRLLDNEELSPEEVDEIQDGVQSYVERNGDEGFTEEEDLYEPFDLPDAPLRDDSDGEPEPVKTAPPPKPAAAKEGTTTNTNTKVAAPPKEDTPPTKPAAPAPPKKDAGGKKEPAPAAPAKGKSATASPMVIPAPKTLATPKTPASATPPSNVAAKAPAPKLGTPASPNRDSVINYAAAVQGQGHSQAQGPSQGMFPASITTADSLLDDDDAMNEDTFGDDAMGSVGTGTLADMAMMTTELDRKKPPPHQDRPVGSPPAASASPATPSISSPALPAAAAAPSGAAPHLGTSLSAAPNPQSFAAALQMLEQSVRNLPHPHDCERLKPYIPPNPYKTPAWYPQAMHPALSSQETLSKFEIEALFFIFYYQPNTFQQYLAAKELKKQSWRYHKRYLTWFQRHNNPKETTDEFERGAYIYFDYESGWCQRIKNDFTFKYQYLEDELQ